MKRRKPARLTYIVVGFFELPSRNFKHLVGTVRPVPDVLNERVWVTWGDIEENWTWAGMILPLFVDPPANDEWP